MLTDQERKPRFSTLSFVLTGLSWLAFLYAWMSALSWMTASGYAGVVLFTPAVVIALTSLVMAILSRRKHEPKATLALVLSLILPAVLFLMAALIAVAS